jgi:hypothetical protein
VIDSVHAERCDRLVLVWGGTHFDPRDVGGSDPVLCEESYGTVWGEITV